MASEPEKLVLKFGGTSVGSVERIGLVVKKIRSFLDLGYRVAVVVSAMGDTTDRLIDLARQIAPSAGSSREMDQLMSTGEQQTIALLSIALREAGVCAKSFTGSQAGFRAFGEHGEGRIRSIDPERVLSFMDSGGVAVVAGFQAINEEEDTITLGRGGSDLSAIALASAIGAKDCYILTDVDGIYTADPRKVDAPVRLDRISWDECLEMTIAGANVLQARSVEMAIRTGVNVCVASSFSESREGTWIVNGSIEERAAVRAVTQDDDTAKFTFEGSCDPGRVAKSLSEKGILSQMIFQDGRSVFLICRSRLEDALKICSDLGIEDVRFDEGLSRVSVVGTGVANHPEISGQIVSVLSELGVKLEMLLSSALSVTCLVDGKKGAEVVRALHGKFIEGGIVKCA